MKELAAMLAALAIVMAFAAGLCAGGAGECSKACRLAGVIGIAPRAVAGAP